MNEPNDLVAALATVDQLRIENARLRLTDAEREAIEWAMEDASTCRFATLRNLLERLK
jgi:hypothetical protein